MKSHG